MNLNVAHNIISVSKQDFYLGGHVAVIQRPCHVVEVRPWGIQCCIHVGHFPLKKLNTQKNPLGLSDMLRPIDEQPYLIRADLLSELFSLVRIVECNITGCLHYSKLVQEKIFRNDSDIGVQKMKCLRECFGGQNMIGRVTWRFQVFDIKSSYPTGPAARTSLSMSSPLNKT